MKKFVALIFSLIFLTLNVYASPSETDSGILYSIENGEVTIEGFNYAGNVMDVPSEIEGYPVKYIANQACRDNDAIIELRLPSSVEVIGEFAFADCKNLKKVIIGGTHTVGYSAFRNCNKLSSLTLPEGIKVIDDSAFENCIMLGVVEIPNSLESIGVNAFIGCDRLRFSIKNNDYAKQYAKQYSIPTSFFESWTFTVIMIAVSAVLILAVIKISSKALKKK